VDSREEIGSAADSIQESWHSVSGLSFTRRSQKGTP
jgi:hypothetical protein